MRRSIRTTAVAILSTSPGLAMAAQDELPPDVAKYVEQREGCEHFQGEISDPPDEQRMKEIEREIRKLCTDTDKKLERLKRKYAGNKAVLKRLRTRSSRAAINQ